MRHLRFLAVASAVAFAAGCSEPRPAGTWTDAGGLSVPRKGLTATTLADGSVLVVGGTQVDCDVPLFVPNPGRDCLIPCAPETGPVDRFVPETGAWRSGTRTLRLRVGHTATALAGSARVLVTGGLQALDAEVFDAASESWSMTGPMATLRFGHQAALLASGEVLVTCGALTWPNYDPDPLVEVLAPVTGTWSALGALSQARPGHTLTELDDGRVLAAGGLATAPTASGWAALATTEIWDPGTRSFAPGPPMTAAHVGHTATRLPDGRVLVAGGVAPGLRDWDGTVLAPAVYSWAAELFDPATGAWSATGSLQLARGGHTAIALPDGRVLVVGGDTPPFLQALRPAYEAELWDPATGRWLAAGSLRRREGHAAALLPDGRVLVVGGCSAIAEIWSPE